MGIYDELSTTKSLPKVQRQLNVQKQSLKHSRFGYYFLFLHCRDIRKIKNLEILEDLCVHWVAVVPKNVLTVINFVKVSVLN